MTEHSTEAERGPEPAHRHTWRGYEFAFDGEHPVAEQHCPCGAARTVRAWERYWDPSESCNDSATTEPPQGDRGIPSTGHPPGVNDDSIEGGADQDGPSSGMEIQQRNTRRGSDRLLEALDRLHRAEERKRRVPFGSDEFQRLAHEVEEEARLVFRLAERQEDFGSQDDPISEDAPGWPTPPHRDY